MTGKMELVGKKCILTMDAGIRWRVWWIWFASRENEMQKEGKEIAFVIRYKESDNDIFTLHLEVNK